VAHYLDTNHQPKVVLLPLPRLYSTHTGRSIASIITELLDHFNLRTRFSYIITDNASKNTVYTNLLSKELTTDLRKRHILCMGYIINLVAHQILFGEDVEAFEDSLENVALEELESRS
jgi:hypothetical protein